MQEIENRPFFSWIMVRPEWGKRKAIGSDHDSAEKWSDLSDGKEKQSGRTLFQLNHGPTGVRGMEGQSSFSILQLWTAKNIFTNFISCLHSVIFFNDAQGYLLPDFSSSWKTLTIPRAPFRWCIWLRCNWGKWRFRWWWMSRWVILALDHDHPQGKELNREPKPW